MKLNANLSTRVRAIGDATVLVVDNVLQDACAVRERGLNAHYGVALTDYPGLHAEIPDAQAGAFASSLTGFLEGTGLLPPDHWPRLDYSIVTVPAEKLRARQQHPHVDPVPYFGLLHLSELLSSGTSFYRSRISGLQRLAQESDYQEHERFMKEVAAGRTAGSYDLEQSPYWELVGSIEARFNRMIFYPGDIFHAVDPGPIPSPFDIRFARLTMRIMYYRHE